MPEKKQRGSALTWRDLKSSTRHSKQKNVPMSWRARLRTLWTWTKRAFFLGLLIFAIWGGIYLYRNACFEDIFGAKSLKISRIEFITDGNLTGEWINKYLKIPADSTLSDVNIFAIKGAIDALGQVKSASVERVFPDVLRIKTSEYKPIAKAKIEINSSIKEYLLAETGEFFEPSCMPVEVFNSLPTVQGLNIVLENGKPLPYRHAKTVTNFLRYANARMPEQASKWNTLRLGALDSRILPLIEVVTQDGVKIIFLPENLKKQFDRLDYILRYSVQKPLLNIEKIDLSLDNRSDVKLKRQ